MNKVPKKYLANLAIVFIFAIIAIWLSVHKNFAAVSSILSNLNIVLIIGLIAIALLPAFIEGYILRTFARLEKPDYSYKEGLLNGLVGSFFSGITPFSSGGQFMQLYIFKNQHIPTPKAAGILLMHFILYQVCMVSYTLFILIFKFKTLYQEFSTFASLALLGFGINALVITVLICGAISTKFQRFLTGKVLLLGHKLHLVGDYETSILMLEAKLTDFRRQIVVMRQHRRVMLQCILCFLLKLTIQYAIPYFCVLALGGNAHPSLFIEYSAICAFIYLITAFIPIPGASGGSEGTYVLLFSHVLGDALATSSMLVWRFVTYYLFILIGGLSFFYYQSVSQYHKRRLKK